MKLYTRQTYLNTIRPFFGGQLIKVLVGARRVGKTVLLSQIAELLQTDQPDAVIVSINLELYEFSHIRQSNDLYQFVSAQKQSGRALCVLIDEVQEVNGFEIALRQLLAEGADIYCTGSNARILASDLATHLTGRYVEFRVHSLSYSEFLDMHKLPNTNETLMRYIRYGGMPYLVHLPPSDEVIWQYLRSIYNTIVLRDVVSRHSIRDVDFLSRLTAYVADNVGSLVSAKRISDFVKSQHQQISANTVLNYMQYLSDAFILAKVPRYDIRGRRLFEIHEKYYFHDLGIRHSLVPFTLNSIGQVFENLVYNKLRFHGYEVSVGKWLSYEIDFVAQRHDNTLYVQVAWQLNSEETIEREFGNLLRITDNYRKLVVSSTDFIPGMHQGVEHIHIREFLTMEL